MSAPSEAVQEFLAFYELYFWRHNKVPSITDLAVEFRYSVSEEQYIKYLSEPSNFLHLMNREVPLPTDVQPRLRPKQLELIQELVNPANRLTLSQKLKQCDVSTAQYRRYLSDPLFAAILYEETNKATVSARHRILSSLTTEASAGNVSAMKLYLEMSGEYTPKQQVTGSETEFKQLTLKLIEVLKRHVDEQTLYAITSELEEVLFGEKARAQGIPLRRSSPVAELDPFKEL